MSEDQGVCATDRLRRIEPHEETPMLDLRKGERKMKSSSTKKLPLSILLVSCLAVMSVFAQRPADQRRGQPRYDTTTETTVTGTVEEVKQIGGTTGSSGTHLTLKADGIVFDVRVGPSWFLAEKGFTFVKGDQVDATGSRVKYQGADALIAREIKKGDKLLVLRDAKGFPVWSRRNR
jgi:hypothetical protein